MVEAMVMATAGAMVEVTAIDRLFPSGAKSALPHIGALACGLLFRDQRHSGEGDFGEVERTRLFTIASVLMAFALGSFIGPRSRRASSGSTWPVRSTVGYDRYLRVPLKKLSSIGPWRCPPTRVLV